MGLMHHTLQQLLRMIQGVVFYDKSPTKTVAKLGPTIANGIN